MIDRILVIGDVHGNANAFRAAVAHADAQGAWVLSLGDITDYGTENYACVKIMHDLIVSGKGAMIIGNHDFKLNKWIKQTLEHDVRVQVKRGLIATVTEIEALSHSNRDDFFQKYLEVYNEARFHRVMRNFLFVHGAAHPDMWDAQKLNSFLRNRAIFGQVDGDQESGRPNRIYKWVDDIPADKYVAFGHDILSNDKVTQLGNAFAIDTGSSKGGMLSGIMLEANGDRYQYKYQAGFE